MPTKHLRFAIRIASPAARVWRTMLEPDTYREWTSAFCEGSYYEGSWEKGREIRFLAPNGEGMVATIAENRPHEFISIRHEGVISGGVVDTDSAAVGAWAPAYENYTFRAAGEGTEVVVDQDITSDYEQFMQEAWPKALARLKMLCEGGHVG